MTEPLTLMAVHAHPDDEASSTGGVLAKYSDEGVRTIVVTCTNGEFGDAPGGIKPGESGHDANGVAQLRLAELREAVKHLGVTELELLGYRDSGMPDWDYKQQPEAFWNVPLDEVAGRIADLIERYRPQVVITYDPDSLYQHPDHVHASRAGIAAVEKTGIPAKLYLSAMRRRSFEQIFEALREAGEPVPDWRASEDDIRRAQESEERITTTVDIRDVFDRKRAALMAHSSQINNSWFAKVPPQVMESAFGAESFILSVNRTSSQPPETDLFAGLR